MSQIMPPRSIHVPATSARGGSATFDNPLRRLIQKSSASSRDWCSRARPLSTSAAAWATSRSRWHGSSAPEGRSFALTCKKRMLAGVRRRAERTGVADRIRLHRTGKDGLRMSQATDFALAFWMLHEVPDRRRSWPESK